MTTTNGGSQGRVVEHVDGIVQSANDRGVKLVGEDNYRNVSKWAEGITPPRRGARVRLGLDASGFVRQLQVLDQVADEPSQDRARQLCRMSALRSAATFCGGKALNTEVSTADVLKVAAAFERWLLEAQP